MARRKTRNHAFGRAGGALRPRDRRSGGKRAVRRRAEAEFLRRGRNGSRRGRNGRLHPRKRAPRHLLHQESERLHRRAVPGNGRKHPPQSGTDRIHAHQEKDGISAVGTGQDPHRPRRADAAELGGAPAPFHGRYPRAAGRGGRTGGELHDARGSRRGTQPRAGSGAAHHQDCVRDGEPARPAVGLHNGAGASRGQKDA